MRFAGLNKHTFKSELFVSTGITEYTSIYLFKIYSPLV